MSCLVREPLGLDAAHHPHGAEFANLDDDVSRHVIALGRFPKIFGIGCLVETNRKSVPA
jgi:hypothetical protein